MYNYSKKRVKMNITEKIQITKAASHKVLSSRESAFLFSVINKTGDMSTALDFLREWVTIGEKNKKVIDGFMLNEHQTLSASIISKVKDEIITESDIEEIIR